MGMACGFGLAGDSVKAKNAFENFFELWKDADPDLPVLKRAKEEYAKFEVKVNGLAWTPHERAFDDKLSQFVEGRQNLPWNYLRVARHRERAPWPRGCTHVRKRTSLQTRPSPWIRQNHRGTIT